jgi:hypothetical protein
MDAFSAVMGDRRGAAEVRRGPIEKPRWWRPAEAERREWSHAATGSFERVAAWLDAAHRDGFTRLRLRAVDYGVAIGTTWALGVFRLGGGAFDVDRPREQRWLEPTQDEVEWLEWHWPDALRTHADEDGNVLGYLTAERDAGY